MKEGFLKRRQEILDRGIVNWGNLSPLRELFARAERGEALTISFIGGSITQGCSASEEAKQYTHRVFDWFCRTFPRAAFTYLNAPVGGTDSQFGAARVEREILSKDPDFLIIEFSVNEPNTEYYMETYEGLVRKVLRAPSHPAVLLVNNIMYDHGHSAQDMHNRVGNAYGLPSVSMRESFYREVLEGNMTSEDLTADHLHPNDFGHEQLAGLITNFLERVHAHRDTLIPPLTKNRFEGSVRLQNYNSEPLCDGFTADRESVANTWYYFADGWTASEKGARIVFKARGINLTAQYRKSVKKPAPIAAAIVDGDEANPIILDANFDQDWGDCLFLQLLGQDLEDREHTVEIRITQTHADDAAPFYLVSLIVGQKV